jgi:sRNA-binding regulator protein Hfq
MLPIIIEVIMLEPNKPIFQRTKPKGINADFRATTPAPTKTIPAPHDDEWLRTHRGANIVVVFMDGERLEGTLRQVYKFNFVLEQTDGVVLVHKLAVKYVRGN